MTEPTCPACNKPYAKHPGVHALCAENERLKAEIEELNAQIVDYNILCGFPSLDVLYRTGEGRLTPEELRSQAIVYQEGTIQILNDQLAAAKARESKVREDVKALRDKLEPCVEESRVMGEYSEANAIEWVIHCMNELETFRGEGT